MGIRCSVETAWVANFIVDRCVHVSVGRCPSLLTPNAIHRILVFLIPFSSLGIRLEASDLPTRNLLVSDDPIRRELT